jgi:hypothetical protein
MEERLRRFFTRSLTLVVRGSCPAAEHSRQLCSAHIVRLGCGSMVIPRFYSKECALTFLGSDPEFLDVYHPVPTPRTRRSRYWLEGALEERRLSGFRLDILSQHVIHHLHLHVDIATLLVLTLLGSFVSCPTQTPWLLLIRTTPVSHTACAKRLRPETLIGYQPSSV